MAYDSAMNLVSKISSLFRKIRRSRNFTKYYRYHRIVDKSHHGVAETIDEAPRIYVSIYVGNEAKRYDVPLMYLSLPRFQQMMIRSQGNDLDTINLDRPIIVDCTPEVFDQLLELWRFKWDFDEGSVCVKMKRFGQWSR